MDETLKTVIFDYEKSTYRIELIKSENSKIFVAIEQTVYAYFSPKKYVVRIRQSALENFIQALTEMREETPTHIPDESRELKIKTRKKLFAATSIPD